MFEYCCGFLNIAHADMQKYDNFIEIICNYLGMYILKHYNSCQNKKIIFVFKRRLSIRRASTNHIKETQNQNKKNDI